MIAQDVLEGKWHTIRGKLKTKWAKLTDDDLLHVDGGIEQLIGRIQRRTGESREAIEHFIDQAAGHASERRRPGQPYRSRIAGSGASGRSPVA